MGNQLLFKKSSVDFWLKKIRKSRASSIVDNLAFFNHKDKGMAVSETFSLDLEVTTKVSELCKFSESLEQAYYITVLSIVLRRYTANNNVLLGVYNDSNDYSSGEEQLIGAQFHAFTVKDDFTFKELFQQVKQNVYDSNNYLGVDFKSLEEKLTEDKFKLAKSISFSLGEEAEKDDYGFFDIEIFLNKHRSDKPYLTVYTDTAIEKELLNFLVLNFKNILKLSFNKLYDSIHSFDIISDFEKNVLNQFNICDYNVPIEETFIAKFESQVNKSPNSTCIDFNKTKWTYREINDSANQLAHYLSKTNDFAKEQTVVVFTERSEKWVISVIAIWKLSLTYIPLDPIYPEERVKAIIESSKSDFIITDQEFIEGIKDEIENRITVFNWKDLEKDIIAESCANLDVIIDVKNLAYIIYTSGSTGTPKGVMIEHYGMLNHMICKTLELKIDNQSRVVQNASQGFDISIWQCFAPLTVGATVYIYPDELVFDPKSFFQSLIADQITILELVPSYLKQLLPIIEKDFPNESDLKLTLLVLNAETLKPQLVQQWFNSYQEIPIVNTYGATEVSDDIGHYIMTSLPENRTIPVMKKPISSFEVYLVDDYFNRQPIGSKGEILISGKAVGRGYYNLEAKSKELFIQNPFSESKERLFRTGDFGRFLKDGSLEFIERKDNQIKINGYRVELNDIEYHITSNTQVQDSLVISETEDGNTFLIAYIVPNPSINSDVEKIKDELMTLLPAYMVPKYFCLLDEFPLTSNGKIDRKKLPNPQDLGSKPKSQKEKTNLTTTEITLISIWKENLNLDNVLSFDNFFELGGHSLLAIKIISRIKEQFNIETFPLKAIFINQTIEKQATYIDSYLKGLSIDSQSSIEIPKISIVSREDPIPMSPAQSRIWYFENLSLGAPVFNLIDVFQIKGELDFLILKKAIDSLVQRHESFRTIFKEHDGQLYQIIKDSMNVPVTFTSVLTDNFTSKEKLEYVRKIVNGEFQKELNLEKGPLLRVSIHEIQKEEYILFIAMHHIITDLLSMAIFLKELLITYDALINLQEPDLPELIFQYPDYAVWINKKLNEEFLAPHIKYWKDTLFDAPLYLNIPSDFPRNSDKTYEGDVVHFSINSALTDRLIELSKRNNYTLFTILLSAYYIFLMKYSEQNDIVIGTPFANRNSGHLDNVIGFFVNILPLRIQTKEQTLFKELLSIVNEQTLDAFNHHELPFDKIIGQLNLKRNKNQHPLFQAWFSYQDITNEQFDLNDLLIEKLNVGDQSSKFDLDLMISKESHGFNCSFIYSTDLFQRESAEKMMERFLKVLEIISNNENESISELSFLEPQEEKKLLYEYNNTKFDNNAILNKGIVRLFNEQFKLQPAGTAIIYKDERVNFQELNTRSNKIANQLLSLHIKSGDFVGIYMDRSPDMVASQLGILKAQAGFIPIDPQYPSDRIKYMLKDSQARILVTSNAYVSDLSFFEGTIIEIDSIDDQPEYQKNIAEHHNDIFYMIYTSGSTGEPKGVIGTQKGAINRFSWQWEIYPYKKDEIGSQKAPLSFVDSISEIYAPLLKGIPVCIIPEENVKDPYLLIEALYRNQVTRIVLIPSVIKLLLDTFQDLSERLPNLNFWMSSGEALSKDIVKLFLDRMTNSKLVNLYGSTEVSADVTFFDCDNFNGYDNIPIGKPINNSQLYILDKNMQPVPQGFLGEIYLAGVGIANGYFNNADETFKRFLKNPFNDQSKLFKTGDMGKYLDNGQIEYLGRTDNQIKIRGSRVELNEIQTTLENHPGVTECIVICEENENNDKRIIAFMKENLGHRESLNEVKLSLKDKLPDFMIPSELFFIDEFPLLPNGKIDKNNLVDMSFDKKCNEKQVRYPRDYYELSIAEIWKKTLKISELAIDDDFFTLGGHSLLGVRMMNLIYQKFDKLVPLAELFKSPTVEQIAKLIREDKPNSWNSLVTIQPNGENPPLFFVPGIGGDVMYFYHLSRELGKEQPFYALQSKGLDGVSSPFASIEEIAANYIEEIKTVEPNGPYYLGGHSFGGRVAYEIAQQLLREGSEIEYLAIVDMPAPSKNNSAIEIEDSAAWFTYTAQALSQMYQKSIDVNYEEISSMSEKEQYITFQNSLEKAGILPINSSIDHLRGFLNVLKANQKISYYPENPISIPIHLFKAEELINNNDIYFSVNETECDNQFWDWSNFTLEKITIHNVSGNHHTMMINPNINKIASIIKKNIEKTLNV